MCPLRPHIYNFPGPGVGNVPVKQTTPLLPPPPLASLVQIPDWHYWKKGGRGEEDTMRGMNNACLLPTGPRLCAGDSP